MFGPVRSLAIAVALAFSAPAFAADLLPTTKAPPAPAPAPQDWHFELTLDGWAPSLSANIGVLNLPTTSAEVGFFKILQHLEGIVPVSFVAYNNNFILGADLFWTRLGVTSSFGPGTFGGIHANTTLNQTFATAYGGVALPIASPNLNVYGTVGVRFFNVNTTIDLNTPVPGFNPSVSDGKSWADPIVGINARYKIDDKWSLKMEGDGGGYPGSGTWQAFGAVSYKWTQQISSSVGFRALYLYDQTGAKFGNGSFRMSQTLYGPELDLTYAF
jgi:hypothetical protein